VEKTSKELAEGGDWLNDHQNESFAITLSKTCTKKMLTVLLSSKLKLSDKVLGNSKQEQKMQLIANELPLYCLYNINIVCQFLNVNV